MQLYICDINLGGLSDTIVHRGMDRPVTFPELTVLAHIHGRESLTHVRCVADVPMDNGQERERLLLTYGKDVVERFWPNEFQALPEGDPRAVPNPPPILPPADEDAVVRATVPPPPNLLAQPVPVADGDE